MAKSIQQAEAELRTAALEYAAADAEYSRQWALNGEHRKPRDAEGSLIGELSEGTRAALSALHGVRDALHAAAKALADAVSAEQRAEAL